MKIIIKAEPKEIADLIATLEGQAEEKCILQNYMPINEASDQEYVDRVKGITINLEQRVSAQTDKEKSI